MEKSEHSALCKHCKNRNMDLPHNIFCNFYGDIPDFDTQCEKYEFSVKVKKSSERFKKQQQIKKKYGKKYKRKSIISSIVLFIVGSISSSYTSSLFWTLLLSLGVATLVYTILDIFDKNDE